jgi:hypothetical protein
MGKNKECFFHFISLPPYHYHIMLVMRSNALTYFWCEIAMIKVDKKRRRIYMKPHIMSRADFFGSKGIVAKSDLGVFVVRDGNEYQLGVEIDADTVVCLDQTKDNRSVQMMLDNAVNDLDEIKAKYEGCAPQ